MSQDIPTSNTSTNPIMSFPEIPENSFSPNVERETKEEETSIDFNKPMIIKKM